MTLAKLSYYAFDVATVCLAIAFILFVVHTTLLAFGRRATLAPVAAGGGAGGRSAGTITVATTASGNGQTGTAGSIGQAFVWVSFVLMAIGLLVRAYLVGRGPWGNL